MTKLCPRGKAAAKRKFKGIPSAYANAYASKICAGKIKDPSGVKRKDFRGLNLQVKLWVVKMKSRWIKRTEAERIKSKQKDSKKKRLRKH